MNSNASAVDRRLSPDARPNSGALRPLFMQTRAELLKTIRALDFVAAVILLPVVLFLLFGAPNSGVVLPDGTPFGRHAVASFGAYGMLGIVLFTFGEGIAVERGRGWLRLVRATPLPPFVYLAAKLVVAIALGALVLALLFTVAAVVVRVELSIGDWLILALVLVAGMAPLAPIGFLIGFWARPSSAGAISLLLLLPLSFVSGYWQPVSTLPDAVRAVAGYLPTFHYAELARTAIGLSGDSAVSLAWLLGWGVALVALAAWGYRRDVGRQFA